MKYVLIKKLILNKNIKMKNSTIYVITSQHLRLKIKLNYILLLSQINFVTPNEW